jgi:hypothetical protein
MTQLPAKVLTANRPGVQYLKAARVKREKYPGAGNAKVPGNFEHSATLPGTIAVIRRFNRETEALAAIVVSAVVSTALLFAVLFQDRHPKLADLTEEARAFNMPGEPVQNRVCTVPGSVPKAVYCGTQPSDRVVPNAEEMFN